MLTALSRSRRIRRAGGAAPCKPGCAETAGRSEVRCWISIAHSPNPARAVLAVSGGLRETGRVPVFTPPEVKPLISAERIAARVEELAAQISRDYVGRSLVLLSVLKGSFVFAADLARAIDLPIRMEFLGVRS